MLYKTIVRHLLERHPQMHDQLCKERMLLPTLERLVTELKTNHEAWKALIVQAKPGRGESQIASEALEMALKELEDSLPTESPPDEDDPLSLDQAMAFLRRPTPPA